MIKAPRGTKTRNGVDHDIGSGIGFFYGIVLSKTKAHRLAGRPLIQSHR